MKLLLATLLALTPSTVLAEQTSYQPGYSSEENCFRYEYREEYIPGTSKSPGYVRSYREKVKIPCKTGHKNHHHHNKSAKGRGDDNSCIEGSILGGIAGGGAGAVLSRGDGRWWAIPLGVVSGAMVGCQIDGG